MRLNLFNTDNKGADLSVPMIFVAVYLLEEEMSNLNPGTSGTKLTVLSIEVSMLWRCV